MAKKKQRSAESWRYVLVADRDLPPEEQSVFVLTPLTIAQRADVSDNLVRTHHLPEGGTMTVGRQHRLTLDLCLTNIGSIENFPVGAPAPWPAGRESRLAYLEWMEDDDVHEIGNEIWAQATLGPDVKNSLPPGGTSPSGGTSPGSSSTTAENAGGTPPS